MHTGLRDDRWSYERLHRTSNYLAGYLADLGLRPGERLLVEAPNTPRLVAVLFACWRAGLVVVPLDLRAPLEFVTNVAERTEVRYLLAGTERASIPGLTRLALAELPWGALPGTEPLPGRPGPEDLAEIVFTSGTTGQPKGVQLSHGNIVSNVCAARVLPHGPDHRLVSLLPLSHMLEQTGGLFFPLASGASIAYTMSRQSSALLRELRARRPTTLVLVPQILELFLGALEREMDRRGRSGHWNVAHRLATRLPMVTRRALFWPVHAALGGHLRWVFSGGAALPGELEAAWERMGVVVLQGYGATECSPFISCNRSDLRMVGSVGWPLPGIDVRLESDEILVHGPNVTRGYWRDPRATSDSLTDGWYRTGDLARRGDEGELYLLGRKRDLIVLPSGMNVYPEDVEESLRREAAVAECAVVGWSPRKQPAVHAVVVPAAGQTEAAVRAAVARCNERLAPHQQITGHSIWPEAELPRTATQKVRKQEVLARLEIGTKRTARVPETEPAQESASGLLRLLVEASGRSLADIGPETELAAGLGLDFLARVELAVKIEEDLGVGVTDEEIASARTVGDLEQLLRAGRPSQAEYARASWPHSRLAIGARSLVHQLALFPTIAAVCRPFAIQGREHLRDLKSPAIFVANHTSHLDAPLVLRALPAWIRRRTAVAAAQDYFYRSWWLGNTVSLVLGSFPLAREGSIAPSLQHCGALVDGGWSLLVFPEGTRSPDGRLQPFKSGIGLLARELHVPVIPIAIHGAHALLPKGASKPRIGPVHVRIGSPIVVDPQLSNEAATSLLHGQLASLLAICTRR